MHDALRLPRRGFSRFPGLCRILAACATVAFLVGAPTKSTAQSLEVDVAGPVWAAPPAPRMEVRPVMRDGGWTWAPGHWMWTGRTYVWVEGRWLLSRPGYQFIPAHWVRIRGSWLFIPARWALRPY